MQGEFGVKKAHAGDLTRALLPPLFAQHPECPPPSLASQDAPRLGKPKMLFFPFDFQELLLSPQSFTANKTSEARAGRAGRKPAHMGAESRSRCSLPAFQGAGRHRVPRDSRSHCPPDQLRHQNSFFTTTTPIFLF